MENRQAFIGIFLIILATFTMPYFMQWLSGENPYVPGDLVSDSTRAAMAAKADSDSVATRQLPPQQREEVIRESIDPEPEALAASVTGIENDSLEKQIYFENELVKATLSNRGGGHLVSWELKKHDYYYGGNVNLIQPKITETPFGGNGLALSLVDKDGQNVKLNNLLLQTDLANGQKIILDENNPEASLEFYLPIKGGRIVKEYKLRYDSYAMDVVVRFENPESFIGNRWYSFGWKNGLAATEENKRDDYDYARGYVSLGGELEKLDVSEEETEKLEKTGQINWTAIRTKYFLAAIIPHVKDDMSVNMTAQAYGEQDHILKVFETDLGVGFPLERAATYTDTFTVYIGPISIGDLEPYNVGLENLVMNRDWYEEIFRPISRWIILPAFTALHNFIPNYGFVIIVFSILVKLLLHPLTKKSYESMSRMQVLSPKMTEMREKYKNEPQRLNSEMMKLYKEQGVNPLGGCLPMLLQMPLLFALFIVFRSTIQLRGEPFVGWITDLSRPDALQLGTTLPFIGDTLHVLPILMGLTMIWQSKMTVTDPKQKAMVYFMPLFLIFIFYSLPSGLNMYYAIFNLLSMVQTHMIKKKMGVADAAAAGSSGDDAPKKADKPAPKKALSIKEQIAQRRAGTAQGNRTQRRQSKKK